MFIEHQGRSLQCTVTVRGKAVAQFSDMFRKGKFTPCGFCITDFSALCVLLSLREKRSQIRRSFMVVPEFSDNCQQERAAWGKKNAFFFPYWKEN